MPNKLSKILFTLVAFFIFSNATVHAATLSLTHIGGLATNGAKYNEWWYTQTNPTLKGTANAAATVTVKINDETTTTSADGSGNWSIATIMPKGDFSIVISSGTESYSFKLHTGQNMPETIGTTQATPAAQSTSAVPVTGTNQVIGITLTVLVLLIGYHYFLTAREKALANFEKEAVSKE